MNVLYIHHIRYLGGASRSLFELVGQLRRDNVSPFLLVARGEVSDYSAELGIPTMSCWGLSEFNNSTFGEYAGMRWVLLLRELAYLPVSLQSLVRAKRRWGERIDIVHVNTFPLVFVAVLAKWILRKPVVLHVRSLQAQRNRVRTRVIRRFVERYVDHVVAIDTDVKESLPSGLGATVVHNGLTVPRDPGRRREAAEAGTLRIGIVANFLAYKGIWEFLQAANSLVTERRLRDLRFVVFGQTYRRVRGVRFRIYKALGLVDNVEERVRAFIRDRNLEDHVDLRGFEADLGRVYGAMDVLCFPSRLDAVGRPVFEAAFFGVPSIVALRTRSTDDAIVDGISGVVIRERDAGALADAIEAFWADREKVGKMGRAARELALERFDITKSAARMLEVYRGLGVREGHRGPRR